MRKRVLLILAVLLLALTASACSSVFAADHSYVAEYSDETENAGGVSGAEVRNYAQLKNELSELVNQGRTSGELSFSGYTGSVRDDMAAACYEIKTQTPMGAWAVDGLEYKLNRIVSYYTAQISVSYKRSAQEIADVVMLNGVSSLKGYVTDAVNAHEERLVLRIFSSTVNEEYIEEIVSAAYFDDPLLSVGEPYAGVNGFPAEGANRIYEIELDYGMDADGLAELRDRLSRRISDMCQAVNNERESWRRALKLAQGLSASFRSADSGDGTADTVSGALLEGRASSMGAALAYKAMCTELGIECTVVRGRLGTLGTQDHYWNIIGIDGDYYHVDISRLESAGAERAFLLDDSRAWGTYMWDSESYPECNGKLKYSKLVQLPEEDENPGGKDEESSPPENTPEPDETPEVTPEPDETDEPVPGEAPVESAEPSGDIEPPSETDTPEPDDTDDVPLVEPAEPVKDTASLKSRGIREKS